MIKNFVGRLAGKGDASADNPSQAPAQKNAQAHGSAGKAHVGGERDAGKKSGGAGKGSRKARRGGARPAQQSWSIDDFQVDPQEGQTRFHDLGLRDELMHAIADLGFQYCSPIQATVLPHTLQGHDAIGKAQTGTGKTAAFLLTLFNDMLCHPP